MAAVKSRYQRTGISEDVFADGIIVTADTGYSNEDNNAFLKDAGINAYIPDKQFRSRAPKFKHQKDKHGKRHRDKVKGIQPVIPATEFTFDPKKKTCICPVGNAMWLRSEATMVQGQWRLYCLVHNIEKLMNYGAIA